MFSVREERIIKIIGRKKMSVKQIHSKLMTYEKPFDANILICNSVSRIIKKCSHYKLNWTLTKEKEKGKLFIKRKSK